MPQAAVAEWLATVARGRHLCLGLSGGVDSMLLLDLLAMARSHYGFALSAVHVHHGLSPHADAWAEHCQKACTERGVGLSVERVQVLPAGQGLEAAAREVRHAALRRHSCDILVLAHHRDDQAETLLLRLMRGAGVHGAASMRPWCDGRPALLRPLLTSAREHIEACARARNLSWVEDESNLDCALRRNFVRHRVLPLLQESFPAPAARLAQSASLFAEADGLLGDLAEIDLSCCTAGPHAGGKLLDLAEFRALAVPRQANLLRFLLMRDGALAPSRTRLDELLRQLATVDSLNYRLETHAVCVYRQRLWVCKLAGESVPVEQVWQGEGELPWGMGAVRWSPRPGGLRLSGSALVRLNGRHAGVSLQLAANRPPRSFKKLCQACEVPPWLRKDMPVVWCGDNAVWVGGLGADVRYLAGPDEAGWQLEWLSEGRGRSSVV